MSRKKPNLQLPFFGVHVAEWSRIYSDCLDYLEYEDDTEDESIKLLRVQEYINRRLAEIDNQRRIDHASLLFDPVSATT